MASDPDQEDLELAFQKPERSLVPWIIGGALVLVFAGIAFLYSRIEQRGLSLGGRGHLVVLPSGDAWAFFLDGAQVKVAPESVRHHHLASGPCAIIEGALKQHELLFEVDRADCSPGQSVVSRVTERMGALGLQFGYWPLESEGQSLADAVLTTELVAAMMDPRADDPQLVPLYRVLFPELQADARKPGTPPALVIQADRNDAVTNRFDRDQLEAFLQRGEFVLAGAGKQGGWVIRTVHVSPTGTPTLERLLVDPGADPWPTELRKPTLSVVRRASAP